MDSLSAVWKSNIKIGNTKWTLSGTSLAGIRTSFYCPELKILLDAGHQNFNRVTDIFITHCHADHIASLPLIILENINNKLTTSIYCNSVSQIFLENMIDSFLMCNYSSNKIPKNYYNFIPLNPIETLSIKLNGQNLIVKSFFSDHRVPTLSYGFIEKKNKLKDEYIGLDGKEIVKLKKDGVVITNTIEINKMVFCGDTTSEIFKNNPDILNFESIVIECTFFESDEILNAKERKHMHWESLKKVIIENPEVNFYLIHISARYTNIEELRQKYLKGINNVFII